MQFIAMVFCAAAAAGAPVRGLDIYFIDVVGGAATLIVTPAGETILIDSGMAVQRDADRILRAVKEAAKRERIDHMITTHWHLDHYGAIGLLDGKLPFGRFYDRGILDESLDDPKNYPALIAAYRKAGGDQSVTLKAGDEVPLKQADGPPINLRCLMASGRPLLREQTGHNKLCNRHKPEAEDRGDNGQSLVLLLTCGEFEFLLTGDLTWNFEMELVCPHNLVGQVDLMQVDHHGLVSSSNPVMVHSVRPLVAVMCNGPKKGGAPSVIKAYRESPGFKDLWMLHRNWTLPEEQNLPKDRVANWDDEDGGTFVQARIAPDGGSFTVRIGEAGEPQRYTCRK
jgi:beta-lactamase superfamily II metal-dependent hydrolase